MIKEKTDCKVLQKKNCKFFAKKPSKEISTFLVFLNNISGYLKFCKHFCRSKMSWSRAFQKCIFYHFWTFFCKHFYFIIGFCKKKFFFCKFAFFHILKVEHKSFPMMYHLTYLDIKHGIQIDPISPVYPVFQVPQQG